MSTVTPLMTVEELVRIPDDGIPRELHAGELVTMAPPGPDHGGICNEIAYRLNQHIRAHRLGRLFIGDTSFLLEEHPDTVFGTDVAFIRAERVPLMELRRGCFFGPPDLAVETISPTDRIKAVHAKAKEYIRFGAVEAWVVNPRNRTITIYSGTDDPLKLANDEYVKDRSILPGFECLVSDLIGQLLFDESRRK